jgi:hypothetical protein
MLCELSFDTNTTLGAQVIKHLKPNAKPKEKKSNKQILKEAKKGMGQQEAEEFGVEAVGFCNAGDVFLCSTANLDGKLRIVSCPSHLFSFALPFFSPFTYICIYIHTSHPVGRLYWLLPRDV